MNVLNIVVLEYASPSAASPDRSHGVCAVCPAVLRGYGGGGGGRYSAEVNGSAALLP